MFFQKVEKIKDDCRLEMNVHYFNIGRRTRFIGGTCGKNDQYEKI